MRLLLAALILVVGTSSIGSAQGISWNPTGTIPPLRGPLPTGTIPSIPLPQIGLAPPSIEQPRGTSNRNSRVFRNNGFNRFSALPFFIYPNTVYVVQEPAIYAAAPEPAPIAE